jgi:membrane protein DedA with SNARE-associated domain
MSGLLDRLLSLSGITVYAIVGALVFAEDAVFIGFLIPGETAAILGGVTASLGHTSMTTMAIVVVIAAILGDTVGYHIGARYGTRLLTVGPLARRRDRVDGARAMLARRGGLAVFLGRFVAFLRATMPFLAGIARMRYRIFLAFNAAGGVVWGIGSVLLGYVAGASYQKIETTFGAAAAVIVAIVAVAAIVVWHVRRHRA